MLLALALSLLHAVPPAASQDPDEVEAAAKERRAFEQGFSRLERWLMRFERKRGDLGASCTDDLLLTLEELEPAIERVPGRRKRVATLLLEASGAALEFLDPETREPACSAAAVRRVKGWFDGYDETEQTQWLTREVLVMQSHTSRERRAALHLLRERRPESALVPILVCARDSDAEVRRDALEALVGWEDSAVHLRFLDVLTDLEGLFAKGHGDGGRGWLAERHFESVGQTRDPRTWARASEFLKRRLTSGDWRTALRALPVANLLTDSTAISILIDGMELWHERGQEGHRSKRLLFELAKRLEERSGRSIGLNPDHWRRWWDAVESGSIPRPEKGEKGETPAAPSRASFFGLRPMTDRVTFVIDRSGSMESPFGLPDGASSSRRLTRYKKAIEEMIGFLEAAGEDAKFNVVLFSDGNWSWRSRLQKATERNLSQARAWLMARRPKGGTMLRGGVQNAMRIRSNGNLDLARLEADTIIVLCDGETGDGQAWILPLLKRVNFQARLVFHGVQVGGLGNGTLELLAEETGGQFVHVNG